MRAHTTHAHTCAHTHTHSLTPPPQTPGVAGANLSIGVVIVLGVANLIADGLSMGIGEYISGQAEIEYIRSERKRERWECDNNIIGEKREMVDIYVGKGMEREVRVIGCWCLVFGVFWFSALLLLLFVLVDVHTAVLFNRRVSKRALPTAIPPPPFFYVPRRRTLK